MNTNNQRYDKFQRQTIPFSDRALSNLTKQDRERFKQFGQGPSVQLPYHCIHHAFEAIADKHPNAIAAQHLGECITYAELNRQADKLAAILSWQGVGVGDNVALFVQRSIAMLIGMLATLKVGAAYVPQQVGVAPKAQLRHVINTTSARVILTVSKLRDQLPIDGDKVCIAIDALSENIPKENGSQPVPFPPTATLSGAHRCFILFTSGTTGKPNGVQVTHTNVCNILLTPPANLGIRLGTKVAHILNIAFDMAAWEIFACLAHGGTLIIRGDNIQQAAGQAEVIIATPSILATIDAEKCQQVKTVAVAGEPCPRPLADKWATFCRFYNTCGPTETTIINTAQHYHRGCTQLTIGKPTPNNTVYILDENRQPCAIGQVGEMWAGGDCVTAGYLDNDRLNDERYSDDPFLGNGRKMFRTRDLGRWTTKGELEHLGRTDDQVKIRGFRVELDSVSTVLESVPACQQSVTLKFDKRNLVAFVSPSSVNTDLARETIARALPYYCTPLFILALDELPKTSRGKVDKHLLLDLAHQHHKTINRYTRSASLNQMEVALC